MYDLILMERVLLICERSGIVQGHGLVQRQFSLRSTNSCAIPDSAAQRSRTPTPMPPPPRHHHRPTKPRPKAFVLSCGVQYDTIPYIYGVWSFNQERKIERPKKSHTFWTGQKPTLQIQYMFVWSTRLQYNRVRARPSPHPPFYRHELISRTLPTRNYVVYMKRPYHSSMYTLLYYSVHFPRWSVGFGCWFWFRCLVFGSMRGCVDAWMHRYVGVVLVHIKAPFEQNTKRQKSHTHRCLTTETWLHKRPVFNKHLPPVAERVEKASE